MNGDFSPGLGALAALVIVMVASIWLGELARRAVSRGNFLQGYFLGYRGLGAWALALTATVQSGGTFMGFPSLVYTYGWIVALWIASYMVVPLTGFGLLAKRIAHLSRRTGAITVPDLFRERFQSPTLGLTASLLILYCLVFTMIAQFKAGAIVMKLALPPIDGFDWLAEAVGVGDGRYLFGLIVFTAVVVGYTLAGGFLAAVWTDLFQSVLMFLGVVILFALAIPAVGGLEQATRSAVEVTGPEFASGPGYTGDFAHFERESQRRFLPISLAFSFFFIWVFGGIGSPASMVRMMACKSTATIQRALVMLAVYNMFIYLPLIAICIAARSVMPDLFADGGSSDEVVPRMAFWATKDFRGGSLLAGLILAAPFGAVMATVSTYLVVIASGIVRDIWQRFIDPAAAPSTIRRLTYGAVLLIGIGGLAANISPVRFLQTLVVFSGASGAATFVVPMFMACYWRRATREGILAAMLAGALSMAAAYGIGLLGWGDHQIGPRTRFRPWYPGGFDPVIWALAASLVAGVLVSLATPRLPEAVVSRFFDVRGDRA